MTEADYEKNDDKTVTHVLLTAGIEVSQYRIVERIGAGGMGEVYLADDTKLNRRVALKFLPSIMSQDADTRRRFVREAQAAAGLDHPNIITVYEVGEFFGRPFFSMQYVKGKTLHHYTQERLPASKVINLIESIAAGLSQAHDSGVIHRDIKSANIMVDSEMHPRILDFGLASVRGGEALTQQGSTLGTIAYMSPEQAQGKVADHRSDLFSLGVVFYELLTGVAPFRRDNNAATLNMILNVEPEALRFDEIERDEIEFPESLQTSLQDIISKCLAKSPESRYQSAKELSAALRLISDSFISQSSQPAVQVEVQPSLAVLPFSNMSADPENEYFSDGLTEELLNVLAKNPELKVTGRTSSFAFKGVQEDLREIGKKLGVRTLLEGSVRKSGSRVRITAQLVSVSDGFHLWSETYDRTLDDIFAVQDEIAAEVSKALDVTLLGKSDQKHTVNPESHALVLRGNYFTRRYTKESMGSAIEFYQQALELDPNNAQAHTGMAHVYAIQGGFGYEDTQSCQSLMKEAALRALEIDESIPNAHIVLGWHQLIVDCDHTAAVESHRKAITFGPNDSQATGNLGRVLAMVGNLAEGLKLTERCLELDPLDPEGYMHHGFTLLISEKYEAARAALEQALKLSPGMTGVSSQIGLAYLFEDRLAEALAFAEREESAGYRDCALAMIYHKLGRSDESDKALSTLLETGTDWGIQIAEVYGYRDEIDEAFEWLKQSAELKDAGIPSVKTYPAFKSLHSDPRWAPFLRSVGFQ